MVSNDDSKQGPPKSGSCGCLYEKLSGMDDSLEEEASRRWTGKAVGTFSETRRISADPRRDDGGCG